MFELFIIFVLNKSFKLDNKTALITGAAGLLGLEHAVALLESNCNLVLTDIDSKKLVEVQNQLKKKFSKSKIFTHELNVCSKRSIVDLNDLLIKENINLDILINNAALNPKFEKNNQLESSSRLENFSLEKDLAFSICGIKFLARSIGPATNCGNNETKVAKLIKLLFGLSLL